MNPIPQLRNHGAPSWWNVQLGLDFVGINSPQAGLAPAMAPELCSGGDAAAEGGFFPQGTPKQGTCRGWDTAQALLQVWSEPEGEKKSRKHVWPKITEIT